MQLLTIFLNILAPVFLLVFLGYSVGPRLQIDARSISRIAYFILAPAFLFNVFSQADLELGLAMRMVLYGLSVTLMTGGVGFVIARLLRCSSQMTSAFVLVSVFGNVGNFGFPIIQFKFGDVALVDASLYFVVMSTSGFMIGVAAAVWNRDGKVGAILSVLKTPAIVAAILAILFSTLGLQTPIFIDRAVGLLAGALIPIMLLTLGIQLSDVRDWKIDRNVIVAGLIRLIAGPILALSVATPFMLPPIARGTGVLQTAMPVAVLAALIALEYELLPDYVTTVILFSTLASAVTLTIVLAVV
ncbi:AEC family transporter [Chloroflexi bacterium TSY]|nr:AEC family transporter [Chloroflexi bacterium TSY]